MSSGADILARLDVIMADLAELRPEVTAGVPTVDPDGHRSCWDSRARRQV
jgi:hypothetical protein